MAAALVSVFLASCTSTGDPALELASPALNSSDQTASGFVETQTAVMTTTGVAAMTAEGDVALPEQVASVPAVKPADAPQETAAAAPAEATSEPEKIETASTQAKSPPAAAKATGQVLENGGQILTAGVMPEAPPIEPKKKSFLSSFFGATPAAAAPSAIRQAKAALPDTEQPAKSKPLITLASAAPEQKPVQVASLGGGGEFALPGVRQSALFEIKRKSGLDDDSDVDLHEDEEAPMQMASAAGLARLAPNGLLKQRETVDVACLKPSLVRVLKAVESHYGKKMIVTSGYRSPTYNRKVNGAKKSMHMYCAAADVQVPGVSKWELAKFARTMPGRGGVGTYCHTESVHIDVGPERDWNWRCRRRK